MAVTIKDVAREAGVSVASVSRALNDLGGVTPQTQQRIREVASRLRYVPHGAARSLITRRTHTVGALLPDLHGEFFSELIRGLDQAARGHGLHLLVSCSHGDADEAAAALRSMQGRVDGMVILSPHVDAAFLRANLVDGLPLVLLNSAVSDPAYGKLSIDNLAGATAMARHLLELHGELAFIAGPVDNFDAQQREQGYRAALAAHAPGVAPLVLRGDFSEAAGQRAAAELLRRRSRPRAVFAANDMMAIGCLRALQEAGLRVPQDVALAGFDDIPITRYVNPPLSTVRVRIAELGRGALDQLAASLAATPTAPSAHTLGCEIVVRESCGTARVARDPATTTT